MNTLSYMPFAFAASLVVLAFVAGACVASFVNCAALRRTVGETALKGRSHCPACKSALGPTELVPVVSWLVQRGRCRHCGARVSLRYPVTELVGGTVFALVAWRYGLSLETLQCMLLAAILLYASLVDIDSGVIPNGCIVAAIVLRVAYIVAAGTLGGQDMGALAAESAIGGVAVFVALLAVVLVADKLFGRASMGGGDLKLFFVAGLYFGWRQCLFLVVVACIIGIVWALLASRSASPAQQSEPLRSRPFAFGPSIALSFVATMLWGNTFVAWYAGLL